MLEKEVEPESHTLEGEEGAYSDQRGPNDFGERALSARGVASRAIEQRREIQSD